MGYVTPNWSVNSIASRAVSCWFTPITASRDPWAMASACKSGASARHGPHHDAQKFTSTYRPRNWLSVVASPEGVRRRKSGAARPIRAAGGWFVGLDGNATMPKPASPVAPPDSPRNSKYQIATPIVRTMRAATPSVEEAPEYSRRRWGRSSGRFSGRVVDDWGSLTLLPYQRDGLCGVYRSLRFGRQARDPAILNGVVQYSIRQATQDDADAIGWLYDNVRRMGNVHLFAGAEAPTASTFRVMLQTGSFFLVAEWAGRSVGAIRTWGDEGVAWFDLLVSGRGGAGRALLRAFEAGAQDGGMRLARGRVPDAPLFPEYFTRRGYQPVARETVAGGPIWTLERRLPLLTVREQRREDADAIASLTGEDPWPLSQGSRPGHFVLADGARIAGFIKVVDGGAGHARLTEPVLAEGYTSRKLEVWMIERAASDAGNRGFTTAEVGPALALGVLRRELEERQWFIDGSPNRDPFVKRLGDGGGEGFGAPDF